VLRKELAARGPAANIENPAFGGRPAAAVSEDVLSEILAVEREIGIKLDAERQAARQWLERTRGEIEQAKLSELAALRASAASEEEAAKRAAQNQAAAILQQAGAEAERIRGLEDARLIPIVRQHVLLIAGGRAG
jgi:hypothetical protein